MILKCRNINHSFLKKKLTYLFLSSFNLRAKWYLITLPLYVHVIQEHGETEEFFTSYDEVFESFDDMGLQENLLRGIYAYGRLGVCFALARLSFTLYIPLTTHSLLCRF